MHALREAAAGLKHLQPIMIAPPPKKLPVALADCSPIELRQIARVLVLVSNHTGVSIKDLDSRSRSARVAKARFLCMALIRATTLLPQAQIASIFRRDHAVAHLAMKTIRHRFHEDARFAADYRTLLFLSISAT